MAAAAAAVAPFASVYVQARYVEAFAASVVPHLRAPIVLVTGSEEWELRRQEQAGGEGAVPTSTSRR